MSASFDYDDVINQSSTNSENQEQSKEILYKKQNFASFETQTALPLESPATPSQDSQESEDSSNDSKTSKKSKKIAKTKRSRKLKDSSKWTRLDEIKYWKFYLVNKIRRPYLNMSWMQWKRDQSYIHMAEYVGKTKQQCKSKDQNMKAKNLMLYPGKNIIEIAVLKLQDLRTIDGQIHGEIKVLIEQYKALEREESQHMRMLDQKLKLLQKETAKLEQISMY